MAKVTLNQALAMLQGKVGGIVFKQIQGRLHITQRAQRRKKQRTPNQLAWAETFKRVSDFAVRVKKHSPELVAFYAPLAKRRKMGLRQFILSDGFSPPVIHDVDLSRFTGEPGSSLTIRATDNVGVEHIEVLFVRGKSHHAASGRAVPERKRWRFTLTSPAPTEPGYELHIRAFDRPQSQAEVRYAWPSREKLAAPP